MSAARYIHRNPVKAAITSEADQYEWSSYNSYVRQNTYLNSIVHKDVILELFSQDRQRAIELFIEYTNKDSEDQFIEYEEEEPVQGKSIQNERDAKTVIQEYLDGNGLALSDLKSKSCVNQRNELIRNLKTSSNLSIRDLAHILALDRNIIQRVQ